MNKTLSSTENTSIFKQILPHIVAIIVFIIITVGYFSPMFEGKQIYGGDIAQFDGSFHELEEYYKKEGKSSAWTGSMFSGMPAYQIGVINDKPDFLSYLEAPLKLIGGGTFATAFFISLLMSYIMFCFMGVGPVAAVLGAVAYALSSYNIIIIGAGHGTKVWCLAYMPLAIAGLIGLFRKKYIAGGICFLLGLCFMIKHNHLQIVYYAALLCALLYIWFIVKEIIAKKYKDLLKVSGITLISVVLAVACNLGNFYGNYEMSKESTRGKSELSTPTTSEKQSTGLDIDYAFAWSYGKAETLSLLVPNIHGGESGGKLDSNSNLFKELRAQGAQVSNDGVQTYTYWGDQPFTSGPVYFGAIICFLFILGMILVKNNVKWVILGITIFFVLLSWGNNFGVFNNWFFHNFPLYNKFRSVSMALVIPALTVIAIAVWGLKEFFAQDADKKKITKALYWSFGTTAFICLFLWLLPDFFFNFTSKNDAELQAQVPAWYYDALLRDRKDLLSSDALRSLIFIILAATVLWISLKAKNNKNIALWGTVAVIILVLVDLWGVDRRYLDTSDFKPRSTSFAQTFKKTVATQAILEDTHPSYRVLNLNNPFNEAFTSYFHKSIGGYHAAKMKRYQELIDTRLAGEIQSIVASFQSNNLDSITASFANIPSLNMLNAKYIIFNPDQPPLHNPYAYGNAWFVNDYKFVENADAELASLNTINPSTSAVIDKKYTHELDGFTIVPDSTAKIELVEYKPDFLKYTSKSNSEQLAIFSEVFYANGWKAYIDGKEQPHFCANWTLRGMRVPAGEHEIEFRFVPTEYNMCMNIATASAALVFLITIAGIVLLVVRIRKSNNTPA